MNQKTESSVIPVLLVSVVATVLAFCIFSSIKETDDLRLSLETCESSLDSLEYSNCAPSQLSLKPTVFVYPGWENPEMANPETPPMFSVAYGGESEKFRLCNYGERDCCEVTQ